MKKNIFKNQLSKFIIICLIFVLGACEKITDLKPYTSISDASAFSSPSLIELSMVGVYNACQSGYYNNGVSWFDRGYPFGAASIEQGEYISPDLMRT